MNESEELKTAFQIKMDENGKTKKYLAFYGTIEIGEINGPLLMQNVNFDESKGIAYSKIFKEIETTLSDESFIEIFKHRDTN